VGDGAYAAAGRDEQARGLLDCLERRSKTTYVSPYVLALVHANARNADAAFEWLERAFAVKNPMLAFVRGDTLLDGLRADPRLQDLIGRMKFPV
jgi:hypothetical protein